MASEPEREIFFIEGFVPPLTIDKIFAALANAGEDWKYTYYQNFLDTVLSNVGTDTDAFAPIDGFDVRNGVPSRQSVPETVTTEENKVEFQMSPKDEINYLRREIESAKDMNARLNKVRAKERQDNNSFFWAMVALIALITAGYFGFGK